MFAEKLSRYLFAFTCIGFCVVLCHIHTLPHGEVLEQRHSRQHDRSEPVGLTRSKRNARAEGVDEYQAIRIKPIIDTTTLPTGDATVRAILQFALEPALKFASKVLRVKRLNSTLFITPQCNSVNGYLYHRLPSGSRQSYCQSGCAASTKCGFCNVPANHLDVCEVCSPNGEGQFDCKKVTDRGSGINDTDLVIYVQSANVAGCTANALVAFGQTCQLDSLTDRPVAGCLNICPSTVRALADAIATNQATTPSPADDTNFTNSSVSVSNIGAPAAAVGKIGGGYYRQLEYTLRHELTHVFGFMSYLFAFWRDVDGEPRTARNAYGLPPFDNVTQQYSWSSNVTQTQTIAWRTANGVENRSVHYLVTPNVRREVQSHFGCSDLPGAELENQGGAKTALSHLEKRIFQNEVMSGSDTETRYYSRITLGILADTGWYRVVWEAADRWRLGAGLGCAYATRSCAEWIAQRRAARQSTWPFCDRISSPSWRTDGTFHLTCTADRSSVAFCTMNRHAAPIPPLYQYFVNKQHAANANLPHLPASMTWGTDADSTAFYGGNDYTAGDITDYCPYIREMQQLLVVPATYQRCANVEAQPSACANLLLESFGGSDARSSMCLRSTEPWLVANCSGLYGTRVWGAGCYNVVCTSSAVVIHVGDETLRCERELQVLTFAIRSPFYSHFGNLVCPLCSEACGSRSCPMVLSNVSSNDERLFDLPDRFDVPVSDMQAVIESVAADLRGPPCASTTCRTPSLWTVNTGARRIFPRQWSLDVLYSRVSYMLLLVAFAVLALVLLTHRPLRLCVALAVFRRLVPFNPACRRR